MSKYSDSQGNPITPVILVDPSGNAGLVAPATNAALTNINVTNAATALPTTPLANRKDVRIWNPSGNPTVYIGYANTVTAGAPASAGAQGVPIASGTAVSFGAGPTVSLWGIFATGSGVVQVEEIA